MVKLPRPIVRLIEKLERLPGIGPKSAQRLAFYLLHYPKEELEDFAEKLVALKTGTVLCSQCHNVSETDPCAVCSDQSRDSSLLMVVESPLDVIAIESSEKYDGLYHVLHGAIDPLNNIGPDELYLAEIVDRLNGVEEVILATNPTMEGEATALYLRETLENNSVYGPKLISGELKVTRIGHGLPIGADIEYADGVTIARALEGRRQL